MIQEEPQIGPRQMTAPSRCANQNKDSSTTGETRVEGSQCPVSLQHDCTQGERKEKTNNACQIASPTREWDNTTRSWDQERRAREQHHDTPGTRRSGRVFERRVRCRRLAIAWPEQLIPHRTPNYDNPRRGTAGVTPMDVAEWFDHQTSTGDAMTTAAAINSRLKTP